MSRAVNELKDLILNGLNTGFIHVASSESNVTSSTTGGIAVFRGAKELLEALESDVDVHSKLDTFEASFRQVALMSQGTSSVYASQVALSQAEIAGVLDKIDAVRIELNKQKA